MRALITGGGGFVGHHLSALLERSGDEVEICDLETDITDLDSISARIEDVQPDAIYHLAALAHVGDSWLDPSKVLTVNVVGTGNVLAAARRQQGRHQLL